MPRHHRIDAPGYPRHIGVRGVDGMACFRCDKDRYVFLKYLHESVQEGNCALNAFVLMTNHVHLLATPAAAGAVPAIMQRLGTRYARYFNAAYDRTGPLFEGRYWASLIETDPYFLATMRYIELNPVRACLADSPGRYPWSSYRHNIGAEVRKEITFHQLFETLGATPAARAQAWMAFVDRGIHPDELIRLRTHFRLSRPLANRDLLERLEKARA